MLEVARAEWMAIISECIDRGVLASLPPPMFSNGVNVVVVSCLWSFKSRLSLFFLFNSARAAPSREQDERRPVLRAPPANPAR